MVLLLNWTREGERIGAHMQGISEEQAQHKALLPALDGSGRVWTSSSRRSSEETGPRVRREGAGGAWPAQEAGIA